MAAENPLLSMQPGLLIWTAVTFLVTFLLLRKFAWGPILGAIDEREGRIRDSLEQAERAKADAKKAIAENRAAMDASLRKSQELVARAKQDAERVRSQAREDAREEARKIVEQGRRQLEAERVAAIADLRREAAGLAIRAAEHLLKKELDDKDNRQLVKAFLDRLPGTSVH